MTDRRDVSGVWYGRYVSESDSQRNSFIAVLDEAGGVVNGRISEPGQDEPGIRRAQVEGRRDGAALEFAKQYDGPSWHHTVYYSGRVSEDGTEIEGRWVFDWIRGVFTMQREKFGVDELEDEAEDWLAGEL